jgi:PAS domain S-box-containing protein
MNLERQLAELREELEDRERRLRMLEASEERFRRLFAASNDAIFLVDLATEEIVDVNPTACRMLGYIREELRGAPMSMVHPHEMDALRRFSASVLTEGQGFTNELSCLTRRGSYLSAEISASVIELDGRRCMLASVRDISARTRLEEERRFLLEQLTQTEGEILGESDALKRTLEAIRRVAPTQATVLVEGESGTGKELIARAIHEQSPRAERSLVRVNCAAVPPELFESEFFGHVKGSFTGATRDRIGRFELADGGTLFLDEVGEIPLALQSKLLRVLQEGSFERIGESHARTVDVRVIAATNRELRAEVAEGRFREDLFFRLSVFPVKVPPLRDRLEDIPVLAHHFVSTAARRLGVPVPRLTDADLRNLARYDWPGNVRELQNVIERGVILARGGRVHVDLRDIGVADEDLRPAAPVPPSALDPAELTLDDVRALERRVIEVALEACNGKIYGDDGAAARLGLKPTTLSSRLKKMGIEKPR